jgi:predicted transcriptional regulator
MDTRNRLDFAVYNLLTDNKPRSTIEIKNEFNASHSNIVEILTNYHNLGLLSKKLTRIGKSPNNVWSITNSSRKDIQSLLLRDRTQVELKDLVKESGHTAALITWLFADLFAQKTAILKKINNTKYIELLPAMPEVKQKTYASNTDISLKVYDLISDGIHRTTMEVADGINELKATTAVHLNNYLLFGLVDMHQAKMNQTIVNVWYGTNKTKQEVQHAILKGRKVVALNELSKESNIPATKIAWLFKDLILDQSMALPVVDKIKYLAVMDDSTPPSIRAVANSKGNVMQLFKDFHKRPMLVKYNPLR